MGLFRLAIVAAVGVALLPSDKEQQEILYNRAVLAAEWTMTYCERNAETCAQATAFWGEFKQKAQFAAGLAYDAVSEQIASAQTGSIETGTLAPPAPQRPRLDAGTLKAGDLEPAWGGEARRGTAKPQARLEVRPAH